MNPLLMQYLATLGMNAEQASAALAGWTVSTATRNGEDVAIVITCGPEIHFVSLNERKAMSRKNIIEHIAPLVDEFGYFSTRVPIAEEDHRLRNKLGLQYAWEDSAFTYWIATELPLQRKSS